MTVWNDIIIGICLLLLGWLLWCEFRRSNRLRLVARVVASVVAVVSLACLALPLTYKVNNSPIAAERIGVLLTEGSDSDSVRTLLQTIQAGGMVPELLTTAEVPAIRRLSQLHVLGYGLSLPEWEALRPPALIFHPSPFSPGIASISWKRKLAQGEPLRIQGEILLGPGQRAKLRLAVMGLSVDSLTVVGGQQQSISSGEQVLSSSGQHGSSSSDQQQSTRSAGTVRGASLPTIFELSTIPPQSGRALYRLSAQVDSPGDAKGTNEDRVEEEFVPIEVLPAAKLKILILASTPDFENTFLANWLSRNGHSVAVRTAISKDRSDRAFLNLPQIGLDPLTPAALDKFDLVIADASVLSSGNTNERTLLRRQLAEKGTGLIIRADNSSLSSLERSPGANPSPDKLTSFYENLFPLKKPKDSTQSPFIEERPGTQPLLRDSSSRILVNSALYGSGKLVFTTLTSSYSQMLSGETYAYAAYWSHLLQTASKSSDEKEEWSFTPELPSVNDPMKVILQNNDNGLPQGQVGAGLQTLYLARAPLLPFQWQGTWWPVAAGWQSSATPQGEPRWWYTWREQDWRTLHRWERTRQTRDYAARQRSLSKAAIPQESASPSSPQQGSTSSSSSASASSPQHGSASPSSTSQESARRESASQEPPSGSSAPLPKTWFYALFIVSCLFLWVERKI